MTRVHATLYGSIRTMASIMIYEKNTLAYVTMLWHVLFQVKHSANHVVEVSESTVGTWYIYIILYYIFYICIIYIYMHLLVYPPSYRNWTMWKPHFCLSRHQLSGVFFSVKHDTEQCCTKNPGRSWGWSRWNSRWNWLFNMSPLYGNQSPTDELKGSPATDARFRFTIVH